VIDPDWIIVAATVCGGLGLWLMLPRGNRRGRRLGIALAIVALGLIGSQLTRLGDWLGDGTFGVLATVTVVAAAGTISCRSPVYCAIWFALSLIGTAGLFLYSGAQFLSVATIVVYAGAILVTFLFVLMLAQPGGHAFFDRISWQSGLSAATGALLVGLMTSTVLHTFGANLGEQRPHSAWSTEKLATDGERILATDHVARLGEELFSRQLIAVEVAGTLLLVALVGAIAIVAQSKAGHGATVRNTDLVVNGSPSHG
jgi:NADH-quinone oxidoreductase subunit J